ncbi:hypothetical protein UNDYM_1633 [Undibacterium sp. YM2]|uniref:hypothetical protein n=1 Tax=Undibacterium sp. YM2 TaxID=2058625 RepID=UPI001331EA75|nr:hypothetical protein [Undibacterium sp. YM2]BBB65886.1 hypothetical protein UNDYM_1633 [Undibacterium sp. YM2]
MRLTKEEAFEVFCALRNEASRIEADAKMFIDSGVCGPDEIERSLKQMGEACALRELASKISKAQEADDHGVPA